MKHSYAADCTCPRCSRERDRRERQRGTQPPRPLRTDRGVSQRQRRAERAFAQWATDDNGPGDYEVNGPDRTYGDY